MWRNYFGRGTTIYGVDVEPACRSYEADGIRVFIGDQADPAFWARFKTQVPALDVVIDDGGHRPEQQIITLESLLPHLRSGGVYICEDVHHERFHEFNAYVYGLAQHLHLLEFSHPHGNDVYDSYASPVQQAVASVHQYPCMTVIERTAPLRTVLRSDKRGTQWAPFNLR
jgi:hypothetical protein